MPTARTRPKPPRRLSADERREEVIEAATGTFAERGYHAAGTAEIARRAGVSQPYLYALFPDKRALFLACHDRTTRRIRETLIEARRAAPPGESLEVHMGRAYEQLVSTHRDQLMFQMQAHAAAAADADIREAVRERFVEMVEESVDLHGASREIVLGYIAQAMFYNVALSLDLPTEYRLQH